MDILGNGQRIFIVTDEESSKFYHIQKFSEIDSDSEEDETTTSALDNRLSEAYSLFVSGRYTDSKNLLKSKETWLKEFGTVIHYFQEFMVTKRPLCRNWKMRYSRDMT